VNVNRVKKGFDFVAPFYDFLVKLFFGSSISKIQNHFLSEVKGAHNILIFGGGTGQILLDCLNKNPLAHYYYLDISEKMINRTRQKNTSSKVNFITGSYIDIPDQSFDVIITPFVLDCFNNENLKKEVIPKLKSHLIQNGKWLFSDFNHSEKSRFAKTLSICTIQLLYWFFNIICGLGVKKLPDFKQAFASNRLIVNAECESLYGMLVSSIYISQ
jgi:tRNA (cmo5U34)-methyltransferase